MASAKQVRFDDRTKQAASAAAVAMLAEEAQASDDKKKQAQTKRELADSLRAAQAELDRETHKAATQDYPAAVEAAIVQRLCTSLCCCCCCCSSSSSGAAGGAPTCALSTRQFWVLAIVLAVVGWSLFVLAAVHARYYGGFHSFRGYEWLPGLAIVPLALLPFCDIPAAAPSALDDSDYRRRYYSAMNWRLGAIALLVAVGAASGIMLVVFEWYAPPAAVVDNNTSPSPAMRALHKPTPSLAPVVYNNNNNQTLATSDATTGSIMLAHYVCLCMAVAALYFYRFPPTSTLYMQKLAQSSAGAVGEYASYTNGSAFNEHDEL